MHATAAVTAAVLFAALLHAGWNATAHRIIDRAMGFALMGIAYTVIAGALIPWTAIPEARAWSFLLASAMMHTLYNLLLMRSYQLGDFSQMYPLARGTSPLVVAVISVAVIGQPLRVSAAIGVVAMSIGLAVLAFGTAGIHLHAQRPAITAAVLTGLAIATYTVLDGVGVRHAGSTGGYVAWLFLLQGPATVLVIGLRRSGSILRTSRPFWLPGLLSGAVSLAAYAIVIWAQTRGNLATIAALRESSILFGALIGLAVFHEPFGRRRMVGAVCVVAGVALLVL